MKLYSCIHYTTCHNSFGSCDTTAPHVCKLQEDHILLKHMWRGTLPPLSLSFSLSDYPSLTGRHWSWDPYMCVCRLTLQCWFHACYDVRGLAALLRIDTYDATISGFNLNFWPPFECAGGVLIDSVSLYSVSWLMFVSCFFCISLYIYVYRKHTIMDWWLFQ